jgi:DNA-binding transcriptional MocR family regulator
MLCGSFSKSLSPGFRIGWVVAGKQALKIQRLQHLSTLSSSIPIQLGLSHYLTFYSYDNHLKKLRKLLNERKKEHIALLETSLPSSALIHKNQGGYFVWIELSAKICVETLYEQALEHNISVAPGIIFSGDKKFSHHIRLNCSYACDDKIASAIQTLGKLVQVMESQT